jgi:hypothetical protein
MKLRSIAKTMSPETAEVVSWWANWILVGALIVGVFATWAVVVSGNVKEVALKRELADQARRAAEADLARVKIEARLAPRLLTQPQQNELAAKLEGFKGQRGTFLASPSTSEGEWFVRVLTAPVKAAGWEIEILPGTATATMLQPTGVVVGYAVDPALPLQQQSGRAAAANALNVIVADTAIGLSE